MDLNQTRQSQNYNLPMSEQDEDLELQLSDLFSQAISYRNPERKVPSQKKIISLCLYFQDIIWKIGKRRLKWKQEKTTEKKYISSQQLSYSFSNEQKNHPKINHGQSGKMKSFEPSSSSDEKLLNSSMRQPSENNLQAYISKQEMPLRKMKPPYKQISKDHRYYLSQLKSSFGEKFSVSSEHLKQSMQKLFQYKMIKVSLQNQKQEPLITIPRKYRRKKTLFLDLDETIIHCFGNEVKNADMQATIIIGSERIKVSFNIRPYAITFLKKMKKRWEIVVFTASHRQYADTILDLLDPDGTLIDYRLYRHHCRQLTSDLFVKDLSRINRDLSEVVLVDNSCYSYAMQLDNGIPILPFYEGEDFQLRGLQAYLNTLSECKDVRVVNRNYFKLHQYNCFDNCRELISQLYCNNSP